MKKNKLLSFSNKLLECEDALFGFIMIKTGNTGSVVEVYPRSFQYLEGYRIINKAELKVGDRLRL